MTIKVFLLPTLSKYAEGSKVVNAVCETGGSNRVDGLHEASERVLVFFDSWIQLKCSTI